MSHEIMAAPASSSTTPGLIDQLCDQWKKTLTALSDDATAVSHLAALAHQAAESPTVARQAERRLRALEAHVASLEDKVSLLRHVQAEEEQALRDLEAMSHQADQHRELLVSIWNLVQDASEKENNSTGLVDEPTYSASVYGDAKEPQAQEALLTRKRMARSTVKHNSPPHTPAPHPHRPSGKIVLPLLTEAELKDIPRTTRGRLSLAVINDALLEVQAVARKKAARLDRDLRAKQSLLYQWKAPSSVKTQRADASVEDAGASRPFVEVTEQELRQSCAFFHGGEATARSLLLILCAVHRLHQVPGQRHGQVLYHVPKGGRESGGPIVV